MPNLSCCCKYSPIHKAICNDIRLALLISTACFLLSKALSSSLTGSFLNCNLVATAKAAKSFKIAAFFARSSSFFSGTLKRIKRAKLRILTTSIPKDFRPSQNRS